MLTRLFRQLPSLPRPVAAVIVLMCSTFHQAAADQDAELEAQADLIKALSAELPNFPDWRVEEERRAELEVALDLMRDLTSKQNLLRHDLTRIEREMRGRFELRAGYKQQYLRWVRLIAVGEEHPKLGTVNGRLFRNVVVRRVTDVGLEIRHPNGTARLSHDELPKEWQERFQWDARSAQVVLEEENAIAVRTERLQRKAVYLGLDPSVPRLHSSSPLVLKSIDSSGPIVPLKLHSPAPIQTKSLDSAKPIVPLRLYSVGRVGERR